MTDWVRFEETKILDEKLANAVSDLGYEEYGSRGYINGSASVVETHHADHISLVSFGGNCANEVTPFAFFGYQLNTGREEDQVKILKEAAAILGYDLRKKPEKKR